MFSSTSSINPFANFSSFHHFPPPFSGFDANYVFLNNQLHDPLTSVVPTNPRIGESLTNMVLSNNIPLTSADQYYGPSNLNPNKKLQVKKDRHSKICTAQGIRDRRVRLSIEIAREFFDLQDMLGFDKASKTLEWLLSKSRKAIKELAQMKHDAINEAKCEVVFENGDLEGIAVPKTKSSSGDVYEEKEMEKLNGDAFHQIHLAKESRNKARARARQRTREKICTRKLHDRSKGLDTSSQILTHLRSWSQFKACDSNDHFAGNIQVKEPSSQDQMLDACEESVILKRKMNPSSIFTHQQNLGMSKDVSENTNYISNLPQNWDTDGAIPHSTFPAITNMNLPITGLQISGRPWETHNSECHEH
ncbi:hypothetical protein ACOSQ3_028805 [Xanthoceras sorbifolium]